MKITKEINPYIFRGYDIRGVYGTDLNEDIAYTIGRSFASCLIRLGHHNCVVGRDNRLSSNCLSTSLIKGIMESGVDVMDLGLCTTPMYYFACIKEKIPRGIMVTASHNPKEENGFKFAFDESGNACGEVIQKFYQDTIKGDFMQGAGSYQQIDITKEYFSLLKESISLGKKPLKVIVDCGNGTTSVIAKEVFASLPIETTILFGESDGTFPNHHPDPSVEENLEALKKKVLEVNADVGIAFDGDGDRVGVITNEGKFLSMDLYMILMVRDIFQREENKKVLYDVKCSKLLPDEIKRLGGTPLCSRVGNSYTKRNTRDWDCILGGELSGHVYFRDKFLGFDSGIYAGLRMIELLSKTNQTLSQLLEDIPVMYATPELKIKTRDEIKFHVIDQVKEYAISKGYPVNDIDGVRIDLEHGWVSVRASNTGPNITARFEADTNELKETLQQEFLEVIRKYNE